MIVSVDSFPLPESGFFPVVPLFLSMEADLSEMMQKFSLAGNVLSGAFLDLGDLDREARVC